MSLNISGLNIRMSSSEESKLKRAQSLVGTSAGRSEFDYYPTPRVAVDLLLSRENFVGDIWEPACGDGAISKVLEEYGHEVYSTDLIDRGYGLSGEQYDFLNYDHRATNIITNPPFNIAQQFVDLSLKRTTGKVALLVKLQFLEGAKRKKMFESTPLKTVYVFSKRLSMTRDGVKMKNSGMIAFSFLVFQHGHVGPPTLAWL